MKDVPVTILGGELHDTVAVLSKLVPEFPLRYGGLWGWYKVLVYEVDIDQNEWVLFAGVPIETPEKDYPTATRLLARSLTREYPDLHRRDVHISRLEEPGFLKEVL